MSLLDSVTRRLNLEEHERRLLLLMGALVATLFCAYTIAKVLRDALFLSEFGALALPYGYIGVALAAAGFVWLESRASLRFRRVGATRFNQYAAIGFSLVAAAVFPFARRWTAALFYIWAGSQAMMLLPHFWALALDVWDSRRARSVFPLLGGCGLIGGLAGGAYAAWGTPIVKRDGLMWSVSGLLIVAYLLTRVIEKHRARRTEPIEVSHTVSAWEIIPGRATSKFSPPGSPYRSSYRPSSISNSRYTSRSCIPIRTRSPSSSASSTWGSTRSRWCFSSAPADG